MNKYHRADIIRGIVNDYGSNVFYQISPYVEAGCSYDEKGYNIDTPQKQSDKKPAYVPVSKREPKPIERPPAVYTNIESRYHD